MNDVTYSAYTPSISAGSGDRFVVTWSDDRRGEGILDIYAAIYQLDINPPQITGTTTFSPPAKVYNPAGPGYDIYTFAEDVGDGSGIESVYPVYTYEIPAIFHQLSYTDSTEMVLTYELPNEYKEALQAPTYPGTDIKYFVRARDKAKNPARHPQDPFDFFTIAVNELGDINGDGCHRWSDLSLLEELIGEDPMAGPVANFFSDLDQDGDIDCDDYDQLEYLIGLEDYPGCVPRVIAFPENLEIAATAGRAGDSGIQLPVYLDNDSSEVRSMFFTMMYDSSVFKLDTLTFTQRTSGFSNVVADCRSSQLLSGEEEVLLSGGAESVVSQGSGEIASFSLTVDPDAPAGKYHFTLKKVALVDSLNEEVESIALRGKFFIPEAPPVSIICTPLSDTLLMRGDTLSFNTTLTNHSWQGVTASVYMYGTVEPDGGNEFLVVDTTYVYLPPGARISSITDLEIPGNAPITHYTFTGYVGEGSTIYDDDSFGFDVIGGAVLRHRLLGTESELQLGMYHLLTERLILTSVKLKM